MGAGPLGGVSDPSKPLASGTCPAVLAGGGSVAGQNALEGPKRAEQVGALRPRTQPQPAR